MKLRPGLVSASSGDPGTLQPPRPCRCRSQGARRGCTYWPKTQTTSTDLFSMCSGLGYKDWLLF